jgi:holo-[acyl-carrier protein] synthase
VIVGIGIDLVKISRIQAIADRWDAHFLDRVFTPEEQSYCLRHHAPAIHLSGRFAVKEALLKALGTGLRQGLGWREIETRQNTDGAPEVRLYGATRKLADTRQIRQIFVSISHDPDYAIAQVVLVGSEGPN